MSANPARIAFLVSYDEDDATMTPEIIAQAEQIHPAVVCARGNSTSKIHACNRDLPGYGADYDVVLLISDDMFCRRHGWDELIRQRMLHYFPDTDGALWFFDGSQRKINTLECVGRKRYAGFGYLYHPSYSSFFCDNESSAVGLRDKKLIFLPESICTHEHPSWGGGMKPDATYARNNRFWRADESNFARRQAAGFPA